MPGSLDVEINSPELEGYLVRIQSRCLEAETLNFDTGSCLPPKKLREAKNLLLEKPLQKGTLKSREVKGLVQNHTVHQGLLAPVIRSG